MQARRPAVGVVAAVAALAALALAALPALPALPAIIALVAITAGGCRQPPAATTFPGAPIVLISIDTLRSDHLTAYGLSLIHI